MKKVIQFLYSLDDGGAETLVKNYSLTLRNKNCLVVILVVFPNKKSANFKALAGKTKIISVYRRRTIFSRLFNRFFGAKYITHKVSLILTKEKPAAVHVHSALLRFLVNAEMVVSKQTRVLYTCHSLPSRYFGQGREGELAAAKRLVEIDNILILALHKRMLQELAAVFGEKHCALLHNGIDLKKYSLPLDSSEKENYFRELGIPLNAFVVGHVGRFVDVKNHAFLLDVFCALKSSMKNAFLIMVGDGPTKQAAIKHAQNNGVSEFVILSNRTDVNKLMHLFDAFVFPSKYEGFPLTLIEAQAAGINCYVSDKVNDECKINENVYFLSILDAPEEWAKKIFEGNADRRVVDFAKMKAFDVDHLTNVLMKYYFEGGVENE